MRRIPALVAAFAVIVGTTAAPAEERMATPPPSVAVGSRIRVFTGEYLTRVTGLVMAFDDESITLRLDRNSAFRIPRESIGGLEVSRGRSRRAVKGALAGLALGAVVGAVTYRPDPVGCADGVASCSRAEETAGVSAVFAGVGWLLGRRDRWEPVALDRVRFGLHADRRGAGATVSVGF